MAKVTPENFVRVETNRNFKIYGGMVGGTNRFWHKRDFGESNASGEFFPYEVKALKYVFKSDQILTASIQLE